MKTEAWVTLVGVSTLAFACSGTTTTLGIGAGGSAGAGGGGITAGNGGSAGSNLAGVAGSEISGGSGGDSMTSGGRNDGGSSSKAGAAGGGPVGGSGGQPIAPVDQQARADKLDVLFVVDNSVGMANKQAVLAASVPAFIGRLTNPRCLDTSGKPIADQPTSGSDTCSSGKREMTPVTDMHIGVITTSLGAHGGDVCATPSPSGPTQYLDDHAQLIGSMRPNAPSYMGSGFLSFDTAGKTGVSSVTALTTDLQAQITAAGDTGCGYEAPLEAMYRFFIDPTPPTSIVKQSNVSVSTGVNQTLLQERAAFLRPDSSVAVVVLTDENDCSIQDAGVGWFVGSTNRMPKSTSACATNPNDACCRSCAQVETEPPSGCSALRDDPECSGADTGSYNKLDNLHDSLNLRCFDQKQRFGFDLLYPVSRYTEGLTNPNVLGADGSSVPNPLFAPRDGKPARSNSLVSVSFIVGAPWQDLASDASRTGATTTFLDAASLESAKRWPLLLGDPAANVKPSDPFMIEAIQPRSGKSPLTGEAPAAATSTSPLASSVNGHEENIPNLDDLQLSCIFALPQPEVCQDGDPRCDCSASFAGDATAVIAENSPLCQPPAGGAPTTTQYFAGGKPGARELTLARALAGRAVPGSVCPRSVSDATSTEYGYVPALTGLVERLGDTLH